MSRPKSEMESENTQLNAVKPGSTNVNVNTTAKVGSIRELTPEEKKKKALLDEKRRKLKKYIKIEKGETLIFYTSLDKVDYKEVPKYMSEELETKLVCMVIAPSVDPDKEKELRFTPKQGDGLMDLLHNGKKKIKCTRNFGDGTKTKYEFEALD